MSDFYTNVVCVGNNILYRGVENGRRVKLKVGYTPTMFLPAKKVTNWKNLQGEYLEEIKLGSIRECRDFIKRYEEVQNFKIYGNTRYEYAFIADEHKGMIDWDQAQISIDIIDIEVGSENGFPDPYKANEPITAIAIKRLNGTMKVYGCGDFNNYNDNVTYTKCRDEYDLCKTFLTEWMFDCPDIITGWNTKFFDIPYLVNRFTKILGEDEMKKLSPWNIVQERKTNIKGREMIAYEIYGVSSLDYIELYKWFAPGGKSQESYRLDNIANVELGKQKLSYDEFDNLHQLYKLNYQKFIEYNIVDVELIVELEGKLKLLELALTLAYDTKSNYDDVFTQTRMWDAIIYNYLLERNIVVPPRETSIKDGAFEGAYVKDPQIGMHNWVASFDLNSLYPHLMMQYNISPETLIEPRDYTPEMRKIISDGVSVDKMLLMQVDTSQLTDATLTPNGQFFRTDKRGFLPTMLEEMYDDRKKFKKLMLQAKQEYELEKDGKKKREIKNRISRYENLQLAKKVSLNSAYGAMGSQYFRFYDLRQALGITTAGQLSIRWIEYKINQYMNKLLGTDEDYVIASDTDSIYLRMDVLVDKVYGTGAKNSVSPNIDKQKVISFMDRVCEDKIQPYIDASYKELADYVHAFDQKMQMKREGLSDKGIWTAKKRYILNVYNNEGVQYAEPQMKVMGLEMVKSSTPSIIREKMKEVIKLTVIGNESQVQEYIAKFREEFKSLPPEEVSFPRSVNGLSTYANAGSIYTKGTPIHVRGALIYNYFLAKYDLTKKYQKIQEGEKLKFTYLIQPNPFGDNVISYPSRLPPEFGLDNYIDYDLQFDKAFLDPIKIILDSIGWQSEKTNSLADFF
jgi:DNA polymerase elongation subunit (family B)